MDNNHYLVKAIEQAKNSLQNKGFPAGAVIVHKDKIIGNGISIGTLLHDPTSHAEVAAIREACQNLQSSDLSEATLFASLQPCLMCFFAAYWAGIKRIVYACPQQEGDIDINYMNRVTGSSIQLIPVKSFEEESLQIIKEWEKKMGI